MKELRERITKILEDSGFLVADNGSISFSGQKLEFDKPENIASYQIIITPIQKGLGINIENRFFDVARKIKGSGLEKIAQIVEMGRSGQ